MSDEKQETSIEIIAEMRHGLDKSWHEIDREWARDLPDRLEAALKREKAAIEADALAVGGIVEAARHKPGNAAAMHDALYAVRKVAAEMERGYASEEAYDRMIIDGWATQLIDIVDTARAAPPRNCDVGTAEEQKVRFLTVCKDKTHRDDVRRCQLFVFPCCNSIDCYSRWSQMPYEEGGAK